MTDQHHPLNTVLAAQHAAIYSYDVIAARISSRRTRAQRHVTAHIEHRDAIAEFLIDSGVDVERAMPTYRVPPVSSGTEANELAQDLERTIMSAAATAVQEGDSDTRALALEVLVFSAGAAIAWGAEIDPFPGIILNR